MEPLITRPGSETGLSGGDSQVVERVSSTCLTRGWRGPPFSGQQVLRMDAACRFKEGRTGETHVLQWRRAMEGLVLQTEEIMQTIMPKRQQSNRDCSSRKVQKSWSLCSRWVRHSREERKYCISHGRDSRNSRWSGQRNTQNSTGPRWARWGLSYILLEIDPRAAKFDVRVSL